MIQKRRTKHPTSEESRRLLGRGLSRGAAEAYRMLRTNLSFVIPDDRKCRVIGVTSADRGEGKSTTAINLAYTMAQTGAKVLLLEADLRMPVMAKRLRISAKPGLSNLLARQCSGSEVLQRSGLTEKLWILPAGSVSPNPAELLGSRQMEQVMKTLTAAFDVILVDLPPVNAVTDALQISGLVDGMLVVARRNYSDKRSLTEAVRHLKFADARILGYVMTDGEAVPRDHAYYGA